MTQTRLQSLIETSTNVAIGYLVAVLFGLGQSAAQAESMAHSQRMVGKALFAVTLFV
jgi:ABC-type Na+ efflux pump permease subunit